MRGHHNGEDARDGEPRDEDHESVRQPGDESVAPAEARELAAPGAHTRERLVLTPERNELGATSQNLDELGGERRAGRSLAAPGGASQRSRHRRHEQPTDEEADREDCRRLGEQRGRDADARGRSSECDERRPEPAEIQALERVHVTDHAGEEVTSPVALELCRRERLDPLEEAHPSLSERPQGDVM